MIFITADTHGELERLTDKKLKFIKKFDTLIVLGDFGFVWSGDRQQEKNLKKISKRRTKYCLSTDTMKISAR